MAQAIRVKGLRELQRDFKRMDKELDRDLTRELKQAAEPVQRQATMLSLGRISHLGTTPRWAGMRVGVSRARGSVYIVPSARRAGGSPRPNLGALLLVQMEAAVDEKQEGVVQALEAMLDHLADRHGF